MKPGDPIMLQAPFTSKDCDLRDFPFMPLDVVRLRDSDLAALESPDACWAAVLLWCASWHQIPAASLPDDDRVLANLAGFGRVVKEWMKVRDGALRGWILCADGRLYHPVIAEKANEAFTRKLEQGWRTECARIKKHNQRHADEKDHIQTPTLEEFLSSRQSSNVPWDILKSPEPVQRETQSNRQGEGQGQRQRDTEIIGSVSSSESSTPKPATPAAPPANQDSNPQTTAGEVCKAIKAMGVSQVNPGNILLTTLIDAGATLEEFTGAAQAAVEKKKLNFSYVLGIVRSQREEAKAAAEVIATGNIKPAEKPWYITASGIEAEAKRRNLTIGRDEQIPQFMARVKREAGITAEMERKARLDFEVRA